MSKYMDFYIVLLSDNRNNYHFHGNGHFALDYDEVILDPSVLFYLTTYKIKETQIVYYLPDNILRLIEKSKDNKELQEFLKSFLSYFRYGFSRKIEENDWMFFIKISSE